MNNLPENTQKHPAKKTGPIVISVVFAFLFAYSDLTTQFMLLCGKDLSFSIAVWFLVASVFANKQTGSSHPFIFSLSILLASSLFTLVFTDILPDSWNYQSTADSLYLPFTALIWLVIIGTLFVVYLVLKKPSLKLPGLVLAIISLSLSASWIESRKNTETPLADTEETPVFQSAVYDSRGQFIHNEWVIHHVNFNELNNKIQQLNKEPVSWMTGLINKKESTPVQMQIHVDQGKNIVLSVFEYPDDKQSTEGIAYLLFSIVFLSLMLSFQLLMSSFRHQDSELRVV